MGVIAQWVRQLALLVIVASFLELLAPNNGLKRYVRLVVGFLVITAVLTPLLGLVRGGDLVRQLSRAVAGEGLAASASRGATQGSGSRLDETNRRLEGELLAEQVQQYLEKELRAAAGGWVGVGVEVRRGGTVERITLTAPPGRGAALKAKAAALAGLSEDKISVVEEAEP